MVHVKITQKFDFEIPETCANCPMRYAEYDGNATIEFCRLKNSKEWVKNTISYTSRVLTKHGEKYVHTRDKKCPLKDDESYKIKIKD